MENTLILINGRGGSGKTTTGQGLLKSLDNSAYFDFDPLTMVNPWEYGDELIELGLRSSAALITNFFASHYRYVIMCGGCRAQRHLEYLLTCLSERPRIVWVYLDVSRNELIRRRQKRNRDDADDPAVFDLIESKMGPYAGPPFISGIACYEIPTDGLSVDEVVTWIKEKIAASE